MLIRREGADDAAAVRRIHAAAFARAGDRSQPVEVTLVEALRRSPAWLPNLSFVAVDGDEVVGHVVCTRATVGPSCRGVLGLGPIGVDPRRQREGFGAALMHAVLGAADAQDEPLVGLLGEPAFYGRFGFQPASRHGIAAPDEGWGEYFQVRLLSSYTSDFRGRFAYAAPFDALA